MRIVDVPTAVDSLRYYAGLGPDLRGDTIPASRDNLHLIPPPYLSESAGGVLRPGREM